MLFKAGDMQGAICCYTKALKISDGGTEAGILHRNRSACYLKLEDYKKAEADASKGGVHILVFINQSAIPFQQTAKPV